MRTNVLHYLLTAIATCLTLGAFASLCLAQDAQLSGRALREIGFDSTGSLKTKVLWQDGGGSSITEVKKGRYEYLVTVRTRIHRENLHEASNGMLVITETVEEIEGSYEDNLSELHARAILIDTSGGRKQLWEFAEEADEGCLTEERWALPYYVTSEFGCCDAMALYKAHSLTTGETVMRYHSNLERWWEGNYFAFSKEDSPLSASNYDSLLVGIVYWANEDSVLHALRVRATDATVIERIGADPYYWPWAVELVSASKVSSLKKEAQCNATGPIVCSIIGSDFPEKNLVARVLDDGTTIIIPIKDDDFVLEQTKVNGFELTRLK